MSASRPLSRAKRTFEPERALIRLTPVAIDDLVRLSGASAATMRRVLLELELAGRIERAAQDRAEGNIALAVETTNALSGFRALHLPSAPPVRDPVRPVPALKIIDLSSRTSGRVSTPRDMWTIAKTSLDFSA